MEAEVVEEEEAYELASSAVNQMPPGFRFHPSDWEIIIHYLLNKVMDPRFRAVAIGEIDLNKCEPWDLPQKAPKMGEKEWFFFFEKETKYPSGTRTNRATASGYWKATGKDKEIRKGKMGIVGLKKTLVFYKGRAPKGAKTNWVIHEYRLHPHFPSFNLSSDAKEKWVVCRVFHKKDPAVEPSRIISYEDDYLVELPPLTDYSSLTATANPNLSSATQARDEMIKPALMPSFELLELQHHQNDDVLLHRSSITSSCDDYHSMIRNLNPGPDCSTRILHADNSALPYHESPSPAYQNQDGVSSSMMEWYLTNFPIKGGDDDDDLNSRILERNIYIGGKEPERICKMEPVSFDVSSISLSQETGISSGINWEIKGKESKKLCDEEDLSFSPSISDMDSLWRY